MSRIGLVSLICALTSGGFKSGIAPMTVWERSPFFIFLCLAVAAFIGSLLSRPSLLWEVLDDIDHRRAAVQLRQKHPAVVEENQFHDACDDAGASL